MEAKETFKVAKGGLAKARRNFDATARVLVSKLVDQNELTSSDEQGYEKYNSDKNSNKRFKNWKNTRRTDKQIRSSPVKQFNLW